MSLLPCRCVHDTYTHTVAQHRLDGGYDVELQEAEDPVTLGERCVGRRSAKVGLIRPKRIRPCSSMITLGRASRETVFVPLFFFLIVSDIPRAIHEAAETVQQRSEAKDVRSRDETSYRKCRPPSQSKEHSGFQGLGRWSVVVRDRSGGWYNGRRWARWDRAQGTVNQNVLCCAV